MRRWTVIGAAVMFAGLAATSLRAAEPRPIGFVKIASGACTVHHGDAVLAAHPGVPVFVADILETGADGALGVTFRDNTRVALGPRTRVVVPAFRFAPADHQYGFVIRLLVGTMEYISGLTAKLAPEAMAIETPTATIGVRGTRFVVRAGG